MDTFLEKEIAQLLARQDRRLWFVPSFAAAGAAVAMAVCGVAAVATL